MRKWGPTMPEIEVTTRLQEVIQDLLDGKATVDDLVSTLDTTRERLLAMQDEFRASVTAEGPAIQMLAANEIRAVEQSLQDYRDVLDTCSGYLQGFDTTFLTNAQQNLPLAIGRLNLDFLRFREVALSERGPTTHAGLNHLFCLASLGDEYREQLELQKELEQTRCHTALQNPELTENEAKFYEAYLQLLEGENDGDPRDRLQELGKQYARIDLAFLARRYSHGPTPVAVLNLMINTAWLLSQNAVEPEVVQTFIQQAEESTQAALAQQQQLHQGLDPEDPNWEDSQKMCESLEDLLELVNRFAEWVNDPQSTNYDELVRNAQTLADRAQDVFHSMNARTGTTEGGAPCPICGLQNPAGITRCKACGSALEGGELASFTAHEGEAAQRAQTATRLQRLLETAEMVADDQEDADFLKQQLDEMHQALQLARKSEKPMDAVGGGTPDERKSLEEAAKKYSQSLDELQEGLELLGQFAEEPSRELLEHAKELIGKAAAQLQDVQQGLAPLARQGG